MKDSHLIFCTESFNFFWVFLLFQISIHWLLLLSLYCLFQLRVSLLCCLWKWTLHSFWILVVHLCISITLKRDYTYDVCVCMYVCILYVSEQTLCLFSTVAIVNQRTSSNGIHMQNSNINIFFSSSVVRSAAFNCICLLHKMHLKVKRAHTHNDGGYNGGQNEGKLNAMSE